ncbi:aminopeptidase P family protein [Boudabousia marimammalium]|uniref:Xaa-Pro aminopeptidase n=1 Tax=Boudabousia marimammalium TaxID=156892 RepID=A0A1Q5PMA6_9ACTO|nr:aminopeptidase P family protein [Boudabousia marimammalium]OKL48107.1 Xaa-Pro aminopeptidase [Boudabousia marimammalium]
MSTENNNPPKNVSESEAEAQRAYASANENRAASPFTPAFREFIGSHWGPRPPVSEERSGAVDYLPARHQAIGALFPGERLVIPAGQYKTRSNDTDYRFRAHSAFAHLSGLGGEMEPDWVLVLEPLPQGHEGPESHRAILYFQPRASRSSEQFYADSTYGEFWVGARPSLEEMEYFTGLTCAPIDSLADALAKDAGATSLRVVEAADASVTALVNEVRQQAGLPHGEDAKAIDAELERALSELRLTKDEYEVAQLQRAVDVTKAGFEEVIRNLPRAMKHHRGERVVEGAFMSVAREEGNGVGYETISASGNHANTLHWIDNHGSIQPGDLLLLDAGCELDSLYTADITRTLPVSGKFTDAQREIYDTVLRACEAALEAANRPGARFRDLHNAAVEVLAHQMEEWGILPVSAEESLSLTGQQHRRWMPHGTSHHLGLDVHDCAQARREMYVDALIEPGMCFTIEPALYFREDDLVAPERFRGMGVRIEDDCIVREDGRVERLSESIPRTADAVEQWITEIQGR